MPASAMKELTSSRNELSPDQRCWTLDKIDQLLVAELWPPCHAPSRGMGVASCPCPPYVCPPLEPDRRAFVSRDQLRPGPATLDDLPMEHTRQDALLMLQQHRHQSQVKLQDLKSAGSEFRLVSDYGRHRFDSALNTCKGKQVNPAAPQSGRLSPDEDLDRERDDKTMATAAGLAFKVLQPSWTRSRGAEDAGQKAHPQTADAPGFKQRPQSVSTYTAGTRAYPTAGFSATPGRISQSKPRPDSEPPYVTNRRPDMATGVRTFNHLRWQRQHYPEIHRLVQRYNTDLKVVCGQPQVPCPESRRRESKDLSVASGFFLVPAKLAPSEDEGEMLDSPDKKEITFVLDIPEGDDEEHHGEKEADQLSTSSRSNISSAHGREDVMEEPPNEDKAKEEDAEEAPTVWRCWVDDATVSTVHERPSPPDSLLGDLPNTEDSNMGPTNGRVTTSPSQRTGAGAAEMDRVSADDDHAESHGQIGKKVKGEQATSKATSPQPPPAPAPGGKGQKKTSGKRNTVVELPPPPPPIEEPPVVEEVVVEEVEEEPEPEPEPVPPTYICPSSEKKSHAAEIQRWIKASPFHSASRTMPIF